MIIDCDAHFLPRDAFDYMEGELAQRRPMLRFSDEGFLSDVVFPGRPAPVQGSTPLPPPGTGARYLGRSDMRARLLDYERMGIDRELMLPQFSGWWSYLIESELARALARSYNLAILNLLRRYPEHVIGVALVPLQDIDGAIQEMRWACEQGFKAAVLDKVYPVPEHPLGEPLGCRRELWPFFREAQALKMPLILHDIQHGHRLSNLLLFQRDGLDFFAPKVGHMSLISLFTSGLLDNYPDLKFVFTEAGTAFIKPLVERMDLAYAVPQFDYDEAATPRRRRIAPTDDATVKSAQRRLAVTPLETYLEKNAQPASYYFKRNFYFTIETEEPELPETIRFLGAERLLFATDYPHDDPGGRMKFQDLEVLRANGEISETDKALILGENARGLFGC